MIQTWMDDTLKTEYTMIRVLKDNPDTQIQVLRHKELGKDIVKRVCKGSIDVYRVLRSLSHPNILRVYDVYKAADSVVVLEEYITGQTITEVLEIGLYEPLGVIRIIDSLCNALAVLHSKNVIHRDIKPENVMIDSTGTIKLIDYDAARIHKPYQSEDTRFMGTPGYVAPEQFLVTQTDGRADIFALGILMNVMLTGQHPSKGMYKGKLEKIIEKCKRSDPAKRYRNIYELREQLQLC